ncbi:MAG: peptidylprolyl isomerase [Bacteroidota bacterium]|jgi:peptidyl-prolyl cis-trans isomerase SurA|nr:peptidylprolyl isomerase [Sphingobacteriales bacterium]
MKKLAGLLFFFMASLPAILAQQAGKVVDQIVAVVGDNIILQSEIEMEFEQLKRQADEGLSDTLKCELLRQKLIERIFLNKAQMDSIPVSEERVDTELEKRIRYFAAQFGGVKPMEEFYGKTVSQIKADNREKIKNGMLVNEMQGKVLKDVKVSPIDIKKYYNEMAAEDSLPFYSAEVEVAQLVIEPKVSKEAKQLAYEKITELRERIINGDNFNSLATLYSDDGSAAKGGELGFFTRGQMVPEFEAAAFKLKPDTISKVIETKYGYHILKLIDRKGDNINVRHILVRPKIFKSDVAAARERMDSIIWQVKVDSISFEKAVKRFSDDNFTKGNGGFITAEQTGSTKIAIDELDKEIYYKLEGLKPGDMTEPELITLPGPDRQQVWRVFYLKSESKPHRANLKDDYQKFQAMAMQRKQQRAMETFMNKTKKDLYIQVNPPYKSCNQVVEFLKK